MLDFALVRGVAIVCTIWGLLLSYTSPITDHQIYGWVLLTFGVPISIDPINPSVHRYASIAFVAWSVLFISGINYHSILGVIGAVCLLLGTMLHFDSSAAMRSAVGMIFVLWGTLLTVDPAPYFILHDAVKVSKKLGSVSIALGSMLCFASVRSDLQAVAFFCACFMALRWINGAPLTTWLSLALWLFYLRCCSNWLRYLFSRCFS